MWNTKISGVKEEKKYNYELDTHKIKHFDCILWCCKTNNFYNKFFWIQKKNSGEILQPHCRYIMLLLLLKKQMEQIKFFVFRYICFLFYCLFCVLQNYDFSFSLHNLNVMLMSAHLVSLQNIRLRYTLTLTCIEMICTL